MNRNANKKRIDDVVLAMSLPFASGGTYNHLLKNETVKWVVGLAHGMSNPVSVVLTYKHPIAGGMPTEKDMTVAETKLKKDFNNLIHYVSDKGYKNGYRRYGKLIDTVGFFEFKNGRFHMHLVMDVPFCDDPERSYENNFKSDVKSFWSPYGKVVESDSVTEDLQNKVSKSECVERLIRYIAKLSTKRTASGNYVDCLLIEGFKT